MAEATKRPIKRTTHQVGTPASSKLEETTVVPEDDFTEEVSEQDMLSLLQEVVQAEAKNPDVTLTVPNRSRMKLVFSPNFEFSVYQAWLKRATDKKENLDWSQVSAAVIAYTNTGILLDDKRTPFTVTSPELHKFLGTAVGGTRAAISKLYGSEGHAIQVGKLLIEKAGYAIEGDVQEGEDGPLDE